MTSDNRHSQLTTNKLNYNDTIWLNLKVMLNHDYQHFGSLPGFFLLCLHLLTKLGNYFNHTYMITIVF